MLSYLKIWESDSFIKKFYQLARLTNGKAYDWHFKIAESNRDKHVTGTRQDIIRNQVRDCFKSKLPVLHDTFEMAYRTQIRNSIAHSNYSFVGRNIHLNNYIKGDPASQLHNLTFDQWTEIFHTTIMVYILYSRLIDKINTYYTELANNDDNRIEIIINRQYPSEYQEVKYLKHEHGYYWSWQE